MQYLVITRAALGQMKRLNFMLSNMPFPIIAFEPDLALNVFSCCLETIQLIEYTLFLLLSPWAYTVHARNERKIAIKRK